MKALKINRNEYEDYRYKANRRNRILRFWIDIFNQMPIYLKNEAKLKPTTLVLINEQTFRFETRGASRELYQYLSQFAVITESNIDIVNISAQ